MVKAYRLIITGLVQGVGFRPFIHRLAYRFGLKGYVKNVGGSEVEVWIEGDEEDLERFINSLENEKPPPAIIEDLIIDEVKPRGYVDFVIKPSSREAIKRSNIPPDLAMCRDCLREILDPSDRRYRYAFNSCAWCGPRFSYMYRAPYDRENTAMAKYRLCPDCLREYRDLGNIRRYHVQGISCPVDGPRLKLYSIDWVEIETNDPIVETAKLIDEGYIVAVKGIGGYHVAALASSDDVVLKLRERKKRPSKPFAIMGLDTNVLEKLVYISSIDRELLESPQAPILLLPKKPDSPVSKYVSPGLSHEGVFIAYTPLHYLLLMETRDKFLIMTSGNIHGEPMCINEECVKVKLKDIVDYVLTHDREIVNRVDDSVIRRTGDRYVFLRRSRGYTPLWIRVKRDLGGEYIGFGADLGNVAAIGFEDKIVLTQYIGDLDSVDAQNDLVKYINFFTRNYHINPQRSTIIVDKHPNYYSRRIGFRYAEKYSLKPIEIQHHYAHLIGALYEGGFNGLFIGLAIDGLGWGDDNTIWGGEVLVLDTSKPWYRRVGSLDPLPLTSDRDTYYPLRILASLLTNMGYSWDEIEYVLKEVDPLYDKRRGEYIVIHRLVESKKYILASSTGRLLDIVSAILGICDYRSYEGEPAIKLEAKADHGRELIEIPGFHVIARDGIHRLEYSDAIEWLLENREKYPIEDLAYSFLYMLGWWYGELIINAMKGYRVESTIPLSGGSAVNNYIVEGLKKRLSMADLKIYIPTKIPVGDGGISFGQIIAGSLMKNKDI
ncbi:MAG: carbamoyltransferase HypF [Desulfurococcales archaeon ex4484_58]|nr:MAG: carbamoyltransferase HypF [Desulfurococcales archaeon ex4484_58]